MKKECVLIYATHVLAVRKNSFVRVLLLVALLSTLVTTPLYGEFFKNAKGLPDLTNPITPTTKTITFDEHVFPEGTLLTNQYQDLGVTFQGVYYDGQGTNIMEQGCNCGDPYPGTGRPHYAGNFNVVTAGLFVNPFFIKFTSPQTAVALGFVAPGLSETISAYLGTQLIESATLSGRDLRDTSEAYIGFRNILFDSIRIDRDNSVMFDNIQFGPPAGGTISVTTNLNFATFNITGPANYSGSGTTFTQNNAPAGNYTIAYGDVSGYLKPTSETKTLAAGGSISFSGTYRQPLISVSPSELTLSSANQASPGPPAVLNISNPGTATLTLSNVTVNGLFNILTPAPTSIPAGGQASLSVGMVATGPGLQLGSLTIVSNAPTSPTIVPIKGAVNCVLNVPYFSQKDTRWSSDIYDHGDKTALECAANAPNGIGTIGYCGCSLTSLAMGLNFIGKTVLPGSGLSLTPKTLDDFIESKGDYDAEGNLYFQGAVQSVENKLRFDTYGGSASTRTNYAGAVGRLDSALCADSLPMMVGVKPKANQQAFVPGHYVLVTGKRFNFDSSVSYLINDPSAGNVDFEDGGFVENGKPAFITRGAVRDPQGDLSSLTIAVGRQAELVITDASGRRTGYDSVSGNDLQEIPQSAYLRDSIDDDVTGRISYAITHQVQIYQPLQGTYSISIIGVESGSYGISIRSFFQDGAAQQGIELIGFTAPGSESKFKIQFDSFVGGAVGVTRTASYKSTLDDINNALQLGLISQKGIANSLASKIDAASSSASRGNSNAARNQLRAFKQELSAQTGKQISAVAVTVLTEDADYLIDSLK